MVLNNLKVIFYRQLVKYIILYKNMKKTRDNIKQKILRGWENAKEKMPENRRGVMSDDYLSYRG